MTVSVSIKFVNTLVHIYFFFQNATHLASNSRRRRRSGLRISSTSSVTISLKDWSKVKGQQTVNRLQLTGRTWSTGQWILLRTTLRNFYQTCSWKTLYTVELARGTDGYRQQ